MDDPRMDRQSPAEYFRDLVETALARQHLSARPLTAYYLTDLLCRFIRPDQRAPFCDDARAALALRLGRAVASAGSEQRARLRNLGDFSLFTSGFFPDSLNRSAVDVDYYVSMGEYAYASLSHRDEDAFAEVFADLAGQFVAYMDILAEVSDRSGAGSPVDVLRLYEKWLRTGSARDGQRLLDKGILPNSSIGKHFLQ